jgi:hypothetical protein
VKRSLRAATPRLSACALIAASLIGTCTLSACAPRPRADTIPQPLSCLDTLASNEAPGGAAQDNIAALLEKQTRALEIHNAQRQTGASGEIAANITAPQQNISNGSGTDVASAAALRMEAEQSMPAAALATTPTAALTPGQSPQALDRVTQEAWDNAPISTGLDHAESPPTSATLAAPSNVTTLRRVTPASSQSSSVASPSASRSAAFAGESAATAPIDEAVALARTMAGLLRENKDRRIADAAALAPIESLSPGSLATLEDPRSPLARQLSAADRKALIDARERLASSPDAHTQLKDALKGLGPSGIRIDTAALCTRVSGFGKYQAYSSNRFIAGEPIRAIVYVEVSNFQSRQRSAEQVVDLTQSLSLFSHADDLLVWHNPPRAVSETSKNARRDFYLIQQIELPRTLSVGRYNLKVTVADTHSGTTAQHILPIEVVAQ